MSKLLHPPLTLGVIIMMISKFLLFVWQREKSRGIFPPLLVGQAYSGYMYVTFCCVPGLFLATVIGSGAGSLVDWPLDGPSSISTISYTAGVPVIGVVCPIVPCPISAAGGFLVVCPIGACLISDGVGFLFFYYFIVFWYMCWISCLTRPCIDFLIHVIV